MKKMNKARIRMAGRRGVSTTNYAAAIAAILLAGPLVGWGAWALVGAPLSRSKVDFVPIAMPQKVVAKQAAPATPPRIAAPATGAFAPTPNWQQNGGGQPQPDAPANPQQMGGWQQQMQDPAIQQQMQQRAQAFQQQMQDPAFQQQLQEQMQQFQQNFQGGGGPGFGFQGGFGGQFGGGPPGN